MEFTQNFIFYDAIKKHKVRNIYTCILQNSFHLLLYDLSFFSLFAIVADENKCKISPLDIKIADQDTQKRIRKYFFCFLLLFADVLFYSPFSFCPFLPKLLESDSDREGKRKWEHVPEIRLIVGKSLKKCFQSAIDFNAILLYFPFLLHCFFFVLVFSSSSFFVRFEQHKNCLIPLWKYKNM